MRARFAASSGAQPVRRMGGAQAKPIEGSHDVDRFRFATPTHTKRNGCNNFDLVSKLRNHTEPQSEGLGIGGRLGRLQANGGVHHDEFGGGIYQDYLTTDSE
jgi:hypothetical protein